MAEPITPETEETKPTEPVENSVADQPKEPEVKPAPEVAPEPVVEETPKPAPLPPVVEEEEEEDLPKREPTLVDKLDSTEREIARAVHPEVDPGNAKFDPKVEEAALKEYIFGWAKTGGTSGPTYRECVSQVLAASETKSTAKAEKKVEATTSVSSIPGPIAEATISSDKEAELLDAVRRGNSGSVAELLRLRREKIEEK